MNDEQCDDTSTNGGAISKFGKKAENSRALVEYLQIKIYDKIEIVHICNRETRATNLNKNIKTWILTYLLVMQMSKSKINKSGKQ